ncbi:MAG TPA: glutathione S-transferase family protein [Polaromonas sp.]|uniref:glutathione S-transferase family protein n=1 Tax=Polaromonas sp. TaxID=1869339 RepID=UPI002D58013E|nr:glutathione S-transferase family protein [Polaromonas sp.]HYW57524.1 glutathione S-transferase family protein [Polaromonas sp.]
MHPILIYGFPAGSSMGLIGALEWLGQPYQLCRVDMLSEMKAPLYDKINKRRETPVLVTPEGRFLTETMAIALWMEARDSTRRISYEPKTAEADRLHQMAAFLNTSFTAAFIPLWAAYEMDPPDPAIQATLRAFGREQVVRRHEQLEELIGDDPYLAGARPTLADAILAGVARWADFHKAVDPDAYPRLKALRQRVETDPAMTFAKSIEDGSTPVGSGAFKGHVSLASVVTQFGC